MQADRLSLSSADKIKIHTKAAAGLDPKFSILQTYDGEESCSSCTVCLLNLFCQKSAWI